MYTIILDGGGRTILDIYYFQVPLGTNHVIAPEFPIGMPSAYSGVI